MPSWIFFNSPPNPDIVLDYSDDFGNFNVSIQSEESPLPKLLFQSTNNSDIARKLKSTDGLLIELPDHGKIYLHLRRFMLKRRIKVIFNDVQLSGFKIS